jgi:hypothetical protein
MDMVLAIMVLGAVIFFGALISIGNERQRKAIDALREEAEKWAMQDLRLKRGQLAKDIHIPNPITWLANVVSKASGQSMSLALTESYRESSVIAVSCHDETSGTNLVFTTVPPDGVKKAGKEQKSRLSKISNHHPLIPWRKGTEALELTMLNAGIVFDLELPVVWQSLINQETPSDRLWVYFLP